MKKEFMELQNKMMIDKYYIKGDIEKIISKIDNLDVTSFSDNCNDKNWVRYIGKIHGKFDLLKELILTKKIQNNTKDIVEVGKYLQKLAKELENFNENDLKNTKSDTIDDLFDEVIKKFLGDI